MALVAWQGAGQHTCRPTALDARDPLNEVSGVGPESCGDVILGLFIAIDNARSAALHESGGDVVRPASNFSYDAVSAAGMMRHLRMEGSGESS